MTTTTATEAQTAPATDKATARLAADLDDLLAARLALGVDDGDHYVYEILGSDWTAYPVHLATAMLGTLRIKTETETVRRGPATRTHATTTVTLENTGRLITVFDLVEDPQPGPIRFFRHTDADWTPADHDNTRDQLDDAADDRLAAARAACTGNEAA